MKRNFSRLLFLCILFISALNIFGQAPSVIMPGGFTPIDDDANVDVATQLIINFDHVVRINNVQPSAVQYLRVFNEYGSQVASVTLTNKGGGVLSTLGCTINISETVTSTQLILTFSNPLDELTSYYIQISSQLIQSTTTSAYYAGFLAPDYWNFTTAGAPVPPTIDKYSPAVNATSIALRPTFSLTFNESVDLVAGKTIQIWDRNDPLNETDDVYYTSFEKSIISGEPGLTLTFTPNVDFEEGTEYYVEIPGDMIKSVATGAFFAGIDNSAGNNYRFTTLSKAPVLQSSTPANSATLVSVLTSIVLNYDEAIRLTNGSEITNSNLSTLITILPAITYKATIDANKKIITILPSAHLQPSTNYTVTMAAVEDLIGTENTGVSISFTTDIYNVWTGDNGTTSWSDDFNYLNDDYVAGRKTIIQKSTNKPILNSGIASNEVIVEPGAGFEIAAGKTLTVSDRLAVYSSNSDGNGSVLINGTLSVAPTSVSFYQKTTSTTNTYHISSPVAGATQQSIGCDGAIYERLTAPYSWSAISSTTPLLPAKGYAAWASDNSEWVFSGAINNDPSYNVSAVRTASNYGWNLAGNPYPCAIDLDLLTPTNINSSYYIWLDDAHAYGTYNTSGGGYASLNSIDPSLVPSMHAFYIQVPIGQMSGSLTIPSSARKLNQFGYMKSATISNTMIHLSGNMGSFEDETCILFADGATDVFDSYDSEKIFSTYNKVLDLFSVVDGKNVAVNGFSAISDCALEIPIGFDAPSIASSSIKLKSVSNLDNGVALFLKDNEKGIEINLRDTPLYNFTPNASGVNKTRFVLRLVPQAATHVERESKADLLNIPVYCVSRDVIIDLTQFEGEFEYSLIDIDGRFIGGGKLNQKTKNSFSVINSGVYVIQVVSGPKVGRYKVLIN